MLLGAGSSSFSSNGIAIVGASFNGTNSGVFSSTTYQNSVVIGRSLNSATPIIAAQFDTNTGAVKIGKSGTTILTHTAHSRTFEIKSGTALDVLVNAASGSNSNIFFQEAGSNKGRLAHVASTGEVGLYVGAAAAVQAISAASTGAVTAGPSSGLSDPHIFRAGGSSSVAGDDPEAGVALFTNYVAGGAGDFNVASFHTDRNTVGTGSAITFALDDAGGSRRNYGLIGYAIADNTDTSLDGTLKIQALINNTMTPVITSVEGYTALGDDPGSTTGKNPYFRVKKVIRAQYTGTTDSVLKITHNISDIAYIKNATCKVRTDGILPFVVPGGYYDNNDAGYRQIVVSWDASDLILTKRQADGSGASNFGNTTDLECYIFYEAS
jgi:hypothetical protein